MRWSVLLIVFVSTLLGAFAQSTTQVELLITDSSSAVVPGASVELENIETGLKRSGTSDPAGNYLFPQVIPRDLQDHRPGPTDFVRPVNDLKLLVNNPATVPCAGSGPVDRDRFGSVEAVQVNTVDASIGNAIWNKPIVQLPLNARNIVGLLALQPGVVFTSEGDTDSRNGAVNGGKSDQANVTLDGVDVNDQMDRNAFTSVLRMTPDSVQEFRVTTTERQRRPGPQFRRPDRAGHQERHQRVARLALRISPQHRHHGQRFLSEQHASGVRRGPS